MNLTCSDLWRPNDAFINIFDDTRALFWYREDRPETLEVDLPGDLPGGANALDDLVYKLQQDKLELEEGARLRDRRDRDEDKFQKGTVANYDPSTGFGTIEVGGVEHVASPGTFLPGTGPSRPQLGDRVLVSLDRKGKVLGFMLDSDESA